MDSNYVFDDRETKAEWGRLSKIEAVFDPFSQECLKQAGIRKSMACLEIGPGAGSMFRWMLDRVGSAGSMTAVELKPRFLKDISAPNARVIEGDIRTCVLEPENLDLAHGRYVMMHIPDYFKAMENVRQALRPGGIFVLEEPDFGAAFAAAGQGESGAAFDRVCEAIRQMYAAMDVDYQIGRKLPKLLQSLKFEKVQMRTHAKLAAGGSGLALLMKESIHFLADKLVATGAASKKDIEAYDRFAQDPASRAMYYVTVSAWGRKSL